MIVQRKCLLTLLAALLILVVSGCSPTFSLAPGDHKHCPEGVVSFLEQSIAKQQTQLERVELLCSSLGGSKDE